MPVNRNRSTAKRIKLKVKLNITLDENSSLSYGASPAIWDQPVLPATRNKWTRPTLTPASKLVLDLPTRRMEGWVDLGYTAVHRLGVEHATSRSQVRHSTTTLPSHPRSVELNRKLLGLRRGTFTSLASGGRYQCDPMWQVTPRGSVMGLVPRRALSSFDRLLFLS